MTTSIKTKFGTAILIKQGYYRISSRKEGNRGKMLHRLIFEDFYGYIPENYVVHHKDGNKTNNCILNLQLMEINKHNSYHNKGDKNHKVWLGKKLPKETCEKISNSVKGEKHHNWGKSLTEETKKNISKSANTSGFYRVIQNKKKDIKQGFIWIYHYYEDRTAKRFSSTTLKGLKTKVCEKGFDWAIIDEHKAKVTCEKYGYDFGELC